MKKKEVLLVYLFAFKSVVSTACWLGQKRLVIQPLSSNNVSQYLGLLFKLGHISPLFYILSYAFVLV